MTRRWAVPVVALACCLGTPASPATAAIPKRCDQVGGRNLIKSTTIRVGYRVVKTKTTNERVYYACALPRGRTFVVGKKGTEQEGGVTRTAGFGGAAGRYLVVYHYVGDGGGAGMASFGDDVWDLQTGSRRALFANTDAEGDCPGLPDRDTRFPVRFALSASGVVAAVYRPTSCGDAKDAQVLASVPGQDKLVVLDSGQIKDLPAAGVSVVGRTVTWTKAGVKQTKTL